MGFKMPILGLKGTVENFKGTMESLWVRRRDEYVEPDTEPPAEWREAVRPSGSVVSRLDSSGIEVLEHMDATEQIEFDTDESTGFATVVETHFRIRCECGRRWWALDLSPTTCPRCHRTVAIQSAD